MRKSALNAFKNDFMSIYRDRNTTQYNNHSIYLSKTNVAPFLDANILEPMGEYYSIVDEVAWNKLLEFYKDDISEYEYYQEHYQEAEKLSDKYNTDLHLHLRTLYPKVDISVGVGYNSWSSRIGNDFISSNYSPIYLYGIYSYQEYLDYADRVKLHFDAKAYGDKLHKQYREEFEAIDRELQIKYFGEVKYARNSN